MDRPANNTSQLVITSRPSILSRLVSSTIFFALFIILKYFVTTKESFYSISIWFFLYLSIWILSSTISGNKFGKHIHTVISIPAAIILAVGPFIEAIGSIFIVYIMTICCSVIFFGVILNKLFDFNISIIALTYSVLTFTSIIVTTNSNKLIKIWHTINSDIKDRETEYKIALNILNEKRTKYLVYTLYFIALAVFNFCILNDIILFNTPKLDTAILQSFATYLAFDRLTSNKKLLKNEE